jgi:CheY-like chemotaxis protein
MLRILHIEDNLEDALLIEQSVLNEGIEAQFTVVRDEAQFRSALAHNEFDVVLADSGVPGFNGFKAIKVVREKFPGISYICLSGFDDQRYIEKNLAAGANDYICKSNFSRLFPILRQEQAKAKSSNP